MKVISSGRRLRKDVSAEIRRWLKESAEKKMKIEQERDAKQQEIAFSETSVAS